METLLNHSTTVWQNAKKTFKAFTRHVQKWLDWSGFILFPWISMPLRFVCLHRMTRRGTGARFPASKFRSAMKNACARHWETLQQVCWLRLRLCKMEPYESHSQHCTTSTLTPLPSLLFLLTGPLEQDGEISMATCNDMNWYNTTNKIDIPI